MSNQNDKVAAMHAADKEAGYGVAGSRAATEVAVTTAVYVDDGCEQDSTGDDVRAFYVTPGDDDGEPTGKPETYTSHAAAMAAAWKMAERYGSVEVVDC